MGRKKSTVETEVKPKMFNKGVVFGSVLKRPVLKHTKGGTLYASVQIQCPNDLHGDVRVWGKIWGDAGEEAHDNMKPGDKFRLEGVVQQYVGKSGRVTNFNFWQFRACTPKEADEPRAVFTLVGDVTAIEVVPENDETGMPEFIQLTLTYQSEKADGTRYAFEEYVLSAERDDPVAAQLDEALIGCRVNVSCALHAYTDYFGNASGTLPLIKQLRVAWRPENAEIPF